MNTRSWLIKAINITRVAFWSSTVLALILVPINRWALSKEMTDLFTQGYSRSEALVSFSIAVAVGFFSYIAWTLLGVLGLLKIIEVRYLMSTSKKIALTSLIVGGVLLLSFAYLWFARSVINEITF
jgi:hypothetical protein